MCVAPRPSISTAGATARFDVMMSLLERRFFADTRPWVCGRAHGATLEVAVGTGLNLAHYPEHVRLTGVDLNPAMLEHARRRSDELSRPIELRQADALDLPFRDDSFDTVVCTFGLCEVPDDGAALAEAIRVLRPGGSILLADHVAASQPALRAGQHLLELLTVPLSGERFTRRPLLQLQRRGVPIVAAQRFAHGAIERVHALRPAA